ncbi:MAG: DUF411 domain-containing protein [Gemmatimonadetes bacterium]|nr:DUF411 domain-containing protein [Gemmatimonadota bacterium]
MQRRDFLGSVALASVGATLFSRTASATTTAAGSTQAAVLPTMTVYRSPTCDCCKEWIKYMQKSGFTVKTIEIADLRLIKSGSGVPAAMESCHTALVGAYVVEGHVPADLVKKMLNEQPAIIGLSVPGMVVGSPGMEQGSAKQPYNVMAFAKGGKTSVYAKR